MQVSPERAECLRSGTASGGPAARIARLACTWLILATVLGVVPTASAQPSSAAVVADEGSEAYHAEIGFGLWNASPDVVISSGRLGIAGSDIDFVGDFGVIRKQLPQFRVVLKAAPRHKVRIGYVPTSYESERTLRRTISFGRASFDVGIPVNASLTFRTWRFGYEYDLVSRDRGFVGVIGEVRYTTVGADLSSGFLGLASSSADAFIPAVGAIGRGYLQRRVALTAEVTWFQIPELVDGLDGRGRSVDFDVSGLVTLTRNIGVQAGYRTLDVDYRRNDDAGSLSLSGVYVSSIIRF